MTAWEASREHPALAMICRIGVGWIMEDPRTVSRRNRYAAAAYYHNCVDMPLEYLRDTPHLIDDTIEAFQIIEAPELVAFFERIRAACPEGLSSDLEECRRQLSAFEDVGYGEWLPPGEHYQRLVDYWRREAPKVPDVDLASVGTAAELLETVSKAIGLEGGFRKDLDAFCEAMCRGGDFPTELTLCGWDRISHRMPADAERILQCFVDVAKQYPELQMEIRCV